MPSKVKLLCYLGGLLTAFDLVHAGLCQSDPVSDSLQVPAVILYALRHSGSIKRTHTDTHSKVQLRLIDTIPFRYRGMYNLRGPILLHILTLQ